MFASFVSKCVNHNLISGEDAPWLEYALEKRAITWLFGIPLFIFASLLSNLTVSTAFFLGFYYLRGMTGGFHARSRTACFLSSALAVFLCHALIYPVIPKAVMYPVATLSAGYVFIFAPYNDPKMNLDEDEFLACKKQSKIRIVVLFALFTAFSFVDCLDISKGIFMSIILTGGLLLMAHINHIVSSMKEQSGNALKETGKKVLRALVNAEEREWPPVCTFLIYQPQRPKKNSSKK